MNAPANSREPGDIDALASEYVLGTLAGAPRRQFEELMNASTPTARQARERVGYWRLALQPLADALEPVSPSPQLWQRIAQDASIAPALSARADTGGRKTPWWRALFGPAPAAALAFGLMMGWMLPLLLKPPIDDAQVTQLPQSYVGVLATREGRIGLIVSSLRQGKVLDLKRVTAVPVPSGKTLFLWTITADGVIAPIAAFPDGPFVSVPLPQNSEQLFAKANELAVSLEPVGTAPTKPGDVFVYRGLCGKLWKVPPPASPTPSAPQAPSTSTPSR